jgi:Fe-S-cluster containining protein
VTLQNYFRMYHKLSGMTGTAETEAGEFWDIYKLDVVVIPTNRPISRKDEHDKVYKTTREKYNAVADEIVELTEKGRPVLVGTTSVEISELISRMLTLRKIKHQVLTCNVGEPVYAAAKKMAEKGVGSIIIVDEKNLPLGIITDKDLRNRLVAQQLPYDTSVEMIMTSPLVTMKPNANFPDLYLTMVRQKLHHLIFTEDGTWYLLVHTTCKHLQSNNMCGIYETRPEICREYTTENCEYDEDWTFDQIFETPEQIWEYAEAILPPRR